MWRNTVGLSVIGNNYIFNNFKVMGSGIGSASPSAFFTFNNTSDFKMTNLNVYTDPTYTVYSIAQFSVNPSGVIFENCTSSPNCTNPDITITGANSSLGGKNIFRNCTLSSSTLISTAILSCAGRYTSYSFEKHNGTLNNDFTYKANGKITRDDTILDATYPTVSITPTSLTKFLEHGYYKIKVSTASAVSGWARIQTNATFNGTVTLWLKQNYALGYTADTLLQTYAGSIGSFQKMYFSIPVATDAGTAELFFRVTGTLPVTSAMNIGQWGGF